jgi:hypothetical protein
VRYRQSKDEFSATDGVYWVGLSLDGTELYFFTRTGKRY